MNINSITSTYRQRWPFLPKSGEYGACNGICLKEIMRSPHLLIPEAGCRYEVVCVYLETLTRLEVVETEVGEGGVHQKSIQVSPNPYTCPYCSSKYKTYASVANAATAIWQRCSTCAKDQLRVSDAGPTMPAFTMKIRDTISVMEAKMTATGGLDFEPNFRSHLRWIVARSLGATFTGVSGLGNLS